MATEILGTDLDGLTLLGGMDGTVLVVRYFRDRWCYCLAGPRWRFGGTCSYENGDRSQVVQLARRHLKEACGGVVWETEL